ncbi:hypothetical protein CCACVL1_22874 [Corchorus capsularis]|uniref:Uncharacterized protein n=1 Tax=Corchorus capsularis TaxID=210143 RepID=A0A1R3GWE3_COCAP|nr:hypothetical protein CCACVL1_22874 [Corchorus capsularis]
MAWMPIFNPTVDTKNQQFEADDFETDELRHIARNCARLLVVIATVARVNVN